MIKKKFKAFSLVELMMILLVASLIIAAIAPVVTKKHFRLPSIVNHGAYMCYYENGQLREAKWAGKFQQQELFNRATDNCVFTPPKKAAYFQVSAIGGGGGGGDAGYTGGNWVSNDESNNTMSPFRITKEQLMHMMEVEEDVSAADIEHYINQTISYMGHLIGYANSIGSGAGGSIGYMGSSCSCNEYGKKTINKSVTFDFVSFADGKATYQYCTEKIELVAVPKEEPVCGPPCKTWRYDKKEGTRPVQDQWVEGFYIPGAGCESSCGGGCQANCPTGTDVGGGCHYSPCDVWKEGYWTYKDEKYEYTEPVCEELTCVTRYYTDYEEKVVPDVCYTKEQEAESEEASSATITGTIPVEVEDTTNCIGGYSCGYSYSQQVGRAGGAAANCQSSTAGVPGGLNLTNSYELVGISDLITPPDGKDANTSNLPPDGSDCFGMGEAEQGYALCADGLFAYTCASPSYASYTITSPIDGTEKVKALSASSGGYGGRITGTSTDEAGNVVDVPAAGIAAGTNGVCEAGVNATTCSGPGFTGYCLKHHDGTIEENGRYDFHYGYDQNYLGYGAAGSPGQFKTTIVRSLSDIDLTIKIGRGGSAAALDSGMSGMSGSATSLGTVITAAGGAGGQGKLIQDAETLPVYNKDRHEKESLCYYYDKYMQKNDDGTWKYGNGTTDEDIAAQKLRDKMTAQPDYCGDLINNQGAYKFYRMAGNKAGEYPTPSGVFSSFMNVAFSTTSADNLFNRFIKFGRGGTGGGVEHRCWAGRHDIVFEGQTLDASVYVDQASASAYAIANNKFVPARCREDYDNLPAAPGADGALLIKW